MNEYEYSIRRYAEVARRLCVSYESATLTRPNLFKDKEARKAIEREEIKNKPGFKDIEILHTWDGPR